MLRLPGNSRNGAKLHLPVARSLESVRLVARACRRNIASLGLGFSDFAAMEYLLHKELSAPKSRAQKDARAIDIGGVPDPSPVNIAGAKIRLACGSIAAAVG